MIEIPDGWPDDFSPSEWDCIDKRGNLGPKGAVIAPLPAHGHIHGKARRCAWNLQRLRDELGGPSIRIISGWRPFEYNRVIKGAAASRHLFGDAADIVVSGVSPTRVFATADKLQRAGKMDKGGAHAYGRRFSHVDCAGRIRRW